MRCVICSIIEKKKTLLSPKLDILQKHVGCCTTFVATTNVVIGDWFYNKDAFHNKKKSIYTNKGNELVLNLVQVKTNGNSKNN
jgi:hypothetical protein